MIGRLARRMRPERSLIFFTLLYLLLLLQFPLTGRLPGNSDTLLSISLTNLFDEQIGLFLRGLSIDTILYPVRNFLPYGENCFGLGFIFSAFKLPIQNDIWAYYLFMTAIFSLNSYALFKLSSLFVRRRLAAIIAGLLLSLAGFTLANIDDANVIFVFFPLMALYFIELGLRTGKRDLLTRGLILSGIQIWFGMYIFLFQFFALVFFTAVHFRRLREVLGISTLPDCVKLIKPALAYLLPALPLLLLYVSNHFEPDLVSPYNNPLSRKLSSLHWYHFGNVLPGNLLYSSAKNFYRPEDDTSLWYSLRKTCFPGFILPLLALAGLSVKVLGFFKRRETDWVFFAVLFTFFFAMSFGSNLFNMEEVSLLPFMGYFRVASRAYLFALIAAIVFFAIGLDRLLGILERRSKVSVWLLAFAITAGFVLENVPFPLSGFEYASILTPPNSYREFFAKLPERQIVADLPSDYRALLPQSGSLWTYSRDAIYMNWQTYHRQIIVGGINSYLPVSRLKVDEYIQKLPSTEAIAALKKFGVQYLVFHSRFVLFPREDILEGLKSSPVLKLELEEPGLAIFKI